MGFTIGTLIGILPTPSVGFLLGLLVILIFENVNKYSLFGALILWNLIILLPIYILSYEIGDFLFGELPVVEYDITIFDRIYYFSRSFLVGNLIVVYSFN